MNFHHTFYSNTLRRRYHTRIKHYKRWTFQEDAYLAKGVTQGKTFHAIGAEIGRTENACRGRFEQRLLSDHPAAPAKPYPIVKVAKEELAGWYGAGWRIVLIVGGLVTLAWPHNKPAVMP